MRYKKLKAFTLVELIIVIVIMGILMTGIVQLFKPLRTTYSQATLHESVRTTHNGIIKYISETLKYSKAVEFGQIDPVAWGNDSVGGVNAPIHQGIQEFLQKLNTARLADNTLSVSSAIQHYFNTGVAVYNNSDLSSGAQYDSELAPVKVPTPRPANGTTLSDLIASDPDFNDIEPISETFQYLVIDNAKPQNYGGTDFFGRVYKVQETLNVTLRFTGSDAVRWQGNRWNVDESPGKNPFDYIESLTSPSLDSDAELTWRRLALGEPYYGANTYSIAITDNSRYDGVTGAVQEAVLGITVSSILSNDFDKKANVQTNNLGANTVVRTEGEIFLRNLSALDHGGVKYPNIFTPPTVPTTTPNQVFFIRFSEGEEN